MGVQAGAGGGRVLGLQRAVAGQHPPHTPRLRQPARDWHGLWPELHQDRHHAVPPGAHGRLPDGGGPAAHALRGPGRGGVPGRLPRGHHREGQHARAAPRARQDLLHRGSGGGAQGEAAEHRGVRRGGGGAARGQGGPGGPRGDGRVRGGGLGARAGAGGGDAAGHVMKAGGVRGGTVVGPWLCCCPKPERTSSHIQGGGRGHPVVVLPLTTLTTCLLLLHCWSFGFFFAGCRQ
mmetsp:Transcript_23792/g.32908  ORF Transcript_23792/g.32908 Transcript_23792/m.32908 type:complete len:234 (-) Transcript_23792:234-935(-)